MCAEAMLSYVIGHVIWMLLLGLLIPAAFFCCNVSANVFPFLYSIVL